MSYGSIDAGSFGSRNPFGGPTRQGYQPVATQISPSELQDVFQETSSNIFQINANVVTLEKNLQSLGTSRDTAELRQTFILKSCSFVSSQQDRLRLTRLKTELSDSVQRYGDLQKVHMKHCLQTPFSELVEEGPLFEAGEGIEGDGQTILSEISEEDVEILRQREEALLQIEYVSSVVKQLFSSRCAFAQM
uniref:Syntaxin N-terminal domain-containing protein n=1 Tax=Sinocyclocheilus grahami TaxID=75366 RepID=A0A672K922_SINGR